VLSRLTALNHGILARKYPSDSFGTELAGAVLGDLPAPATFTVEQAQRMVVLLGLAGASLSRHYQEGDATRRGTPERAFDAFPVGRARIPFRAYFGELTSRTGTGHCHRDSYASLVRWNAPTTEVWWSGARLAVLPGVFDDGLVRTYTGAPDERRFFELVKVSETLELAANAVLAPVHETTVDAHDDEARRRILIAAIVLEALRRVNARFAALPPEAGMRPNHFMDVFRQFAVHWTRGDVPPSGALDPEAISRDFILGTITPAYLTHLDRLLPALLTDEREAVGRLRTRPSLPEVVLRQLRVDRSTLLEASRDQLRAMVGRHPVLAALYLLLNAHARVSGVHLLLAKKFLFAPQSHREAGGLGDSGVVSNRRGTTGMDEAFLEELTRERHRHGLAMLRRVGTAELVSVAGIAQVRREAPADVTDLVRLIMPGGDANGPDRALTATGAPWLGRGEARP
jgi:hypothetical protein